MPPRIKLLLNLILVQGLVLLFGILALELSFGYWFSGHDLGNIPLLRDYEYNFDSSNLYPIDRPVNYRRDHFGIRGDFEEYSDINLLTLGGSTTDQRYIPLESTFQEVMERDLKSAGHNVIVANAGVDGHSTVGHILAIQHWIPQIPNLNPEFIIVYAGLNDINVGDVERARFDNTLNTALAHKSIGTKLESAIRDKSAIYRLYAIIRGSLNANRVFPIGSHKRRERSPEERWEHVNMLPPVPDESWSLRIKEYEHRVRTLIKMIRKFGSEPIFITQTTAINQYKDGRRMVLRTPDSVPLTHQGSDVLWHFNTKTLQACKELEAICLDLARELHLDDTDFYDLGHTTPSGSEKIGHWIANKLLKEPRFITRTYN